MLGFEPSLMPEEDLAIFRNVQWHGGATESLMPWAKKIGPRDRLFLVREATTPPEIPLLEWHHLGQQVWVGRLPREGVAAEEPAPNVYLNIPTIFLESEPGANVEEDGGLLDIEDTF